MAENIKGSSNQGQRNPQSNANQSQKQGAGEKSVSNPGTSGNQPGDPNKNKMSPGIEQDRS